MDSELKIDAVLKELMKVQGETLSSISKATGVPKSTVSEWLGKRSPNLTQAAKVANYFGISLYYLLFGKDDPQDPKQEDLNKYLFKVFFEIDIKKVNTDGTRGEF